MIDHCRPHLCHFNKDYVTVVEGELAIVEADKGGAGTVTFEAANSSILLKTHNNPPLLWSLENRKCADGAFITFADDQAHLHIVELKSTLTQAEWSKVLKQFEGMFLASVATASILRIDTIASVTCYVAFKTDKMDPLQSASPALIKTMVGRSNPFSGQREWTDEILELPHDRSAQIKKIRRGADGNAAYGAI